MKESKIQTSLSSLFEALDPNASVITNDHRQQVLGSVNAAEDELAAEIKAKAEADAKQKLEQDQKELTSKLEDVEAEAKKRVEEVQQQCKNDIEKIKGMSTAAFDKLKQEYECKIQSIISQQKSDNVDAITAAQQQQQEKDEKVATLKAKELVEQMTAKFEKEIKRIEEETEMMVDTYLDEKAGFHVEANLIAQNEALKEVFAKIRETIIEQSVLDKTVSEKISELKESVSKTSDEAIAKSTELNKQNKSLTEENETLKKQLDSYKAKELLTEKVKDLSPREARIVSRKLDGKTSSEIESEFTAIVESIRSEDEAERERLRSAPSNIDSRLGRKSVDEPKKAKINESAPSEVDVWAGIVAKNINKN